MTTNTTWLFDDLSNPLALDAGTNSDGWYTPSYLIDAAKIVLGSIDCDPASCEAAQSVVQAQRFYTQSEDGLLQPWVGKVWINPPYSNPMPWVSRLVDGYASGEITAALMLVNCACSPRWASLLWRCASAVCLFHQRLKFWHPTKMNPNGSYDRDSMMVYFGTDTALFRATFERYGAIR